MKLKPKFGLLLICGLLSGFIACKKENTAHNYAPTGKWLQVKLRTYILDSGKITYDTTYLSPFTSLDYVSFNSHDTCAISVDHYYYINSPGYPKTPQLIPQSIDYFGYKALGSGKFVLNTESMLTNPGGFVTADTVIEISNNSLLIHNVFYSHAPGYSSVTDSYYQK